MKSPVDTLSQSCIKIESLANTADALLLETYEKRPVVLDGLDLWHGGAVVRGYLQEVGKYLSSIVVPVLQSHVMPPVLAAGVYVSTSVPANGPMSAMVTVMTPVAVVTATPDTAPPTALESILAMLISAKTAPAFAPVGYSP